MRQFRTRRKFKISKKDLIIISIILLLIGLFFSFKLIKKNVTPIIMEYALSKTRKIATLIITQAVNDNVYDLIDDDMLIETSKDSNGNIKEIDINSIYVNKLLNMITNYTQDYLEKLENGDVDSLGVSDTIFSDYDIHKLKSGIIYEIPSGVVFNNSLFSNLGPKIPVRMSLIGDVVSDIKSSITDYGINNALIKVDVVVDVQIKVILPISSKETTATTSIPIIMKIIEGNVPSYYYQTLDRNS